MLRFKTIKVEIIASHVEDVLELLKRESLQLRDIEYVQANHVYVTFHNIGVSRLQAIVKQLKQADTIQIVRIRGMIPKTINILCRYEFLLAFIVSVIILYVCMNIIWKVEINGLSEEVEYKVVNVLRSAQIKEGNWLPKTDNFAHIEQGLLKEVPSLLFVRLKRDGNYFYVEAIEKTEVRNDNPPMKHELRASKAGIIRNIFISSGIATVSINDYVQAGDPLIVTYEQTETDEENEIFDEVEGKIFAETWYEVTLEQNISSTFEKMIDESSERYELILGNLEISLPHFQQWKVQDDKTNERSLYHLYFLKWKTPIKVRKTVYWQVTENNRLERVDDKRESIIEVGLEQFKSKIGNDVEILMYDVLYDTIEENKLKVKLFVSVYENIAVP